jgi:hypothetical protein
MYFTAAGKMQVLQQPSQVHSGKLQGQEQHTKHTYLHDATTAHAWHGCSWITDSPEPHMA